MEVRSGCDVNESLTRFACERQQELCVLSGRRFVTNFTLKQPATTGATVTLHGRFEILSMVAPSSPLPAHQGSPVRQSTWQQHRGEVVGGAVVGALIAMVVSLVNATFDRLRWMRTMMPRQSRANIIRVVINSTS